MGGAPSLCSGPQLPDIDVKRVAEIVFHLIPKLVESMEKFKKQFKEGMEKQKPHAYKIDKKVLGKSVELEEGKTTEKELDKWSVTAGLYAELRPDIKNEVWKEMEPIFEKEIPEHIKGHLRVVTLKATRKASDVIVDKLLDNVLSKITEKLDNGQGFALPKLDDMAAVIDALKNPGKAAAKAAQKIEDKHKEKKTDSEKEAVEEKQEEKQEEVSAQ